LPKSRNTLADRINSLLPQTQCTKCGFDGCRPYAEAIAAGEAKINRCPPGGQTGIRQLAELLGTQELPLDPDYGTEQPLLLAVIDEEHCIGCTLCIQACPVDAIVGANKVMHTVLTKQCTGCDLCVEPCPVDCITMVPAQREWTTDDAHKAKANYEARQNRLRSQHPETSALAARVLANKGQLSHKADVDLDARKAAATRALELARARRRQAQQTSNEQS